MDLDGFPDRLEARLGTKPDRAADAFRCWADRDAGGALRLHYGPHSDRCAFAVQWTTDLADPDSWQTLDGVDFSGDFGEQVAALAAPDEPIFYRMLVSEAD